MVKMVVKAAAVASLVLLCSCATGVQAEKEYLFVPMHIAYFSTEKIDDVTFDPALNKIDSLPDKSTAVFYKGAGSDKFKKATCNEMYFLTAKKEEIKRFDPNRDDLLVMKADFTGGSTTWMYLLLAYAELSLPNLYAKHIYFDINKVKGDYIETSYCIFAINIGKKPITTLVIADVMPQFIELNGQITYAAEDAFVPLNVDIARIAGVEHKIIEKDGKRVVVFSVLPGKEGIAPGEGVEIIVPIKILKSKLMQEQYKIKE